MQDFNDNLNPFVHDAGKVVPTAQAIAEGKAGPEAVKQVYDSLGPDNIINYFRGLAARGDVGALEKLFNYYASEQSAKTARDWTSFREDNAYQRLMLDLKKAGVSPYFLSGATPSVSSSGGRSYSGSEMTSRANNENSQKTTKDSNTLRAILQIIGTIISASIFALA